MQREYLLFCLSGPLSAWGEIAVGERRSSWPRPSKSAVLGLVAAALGYDRQDASAHAALNDGLSLAVRVDIPLHERGSSWGREEGLKPLRDYHTAQVPSAMKGKRWFTRAQELSENKLNTILSDRWYWINMTATVALWWIEGGSAPALTEVAEALKEPVFALYLGRKACPLGQPLSPGLVQADSILSAFAGFDVLEGEKRARALPAKYSAAVRVIYTALAAKAGSEIWADAAAMPQDERLIVHSRRDSIRDRRSWTFSDRPEVCIRTGGGNVSDPR